MNILFVSFLPFNPSFGGVERVTDVLSKALSSRGHRVYYLCDYVENRIMLEYDFPVPLFIFPYRGGFDSNGNIMYYKELLKEQAIDVVVYQQALFACWYETLLLAPKCVSVLHAMPDYSVKTEMQRIFYTPKNIREYIKYPVKLLLYPFLYYVVKHRLGSLLSKHYSFIAQHSDAVVLLSDRYITDFKKYLPREIEPKVIKGISNPNTYPLQQLDINIKEKILLYVGRLEGYDKCPMRILRIWKRLYKKHPDWQLLIVGDGHERLPMQNYIDKYGLKRATLLGRKCNVEEYYKRASMICLTSTSEGWGMVLTEGMQFGCIPFAFDNSGAAYDIIDDGANGFLIPSFSLKAYANRLSNLMEDEEMRTSMAVAAYNKSKIFDVFNIAQHWEKLFETILAKNK